jgi:hypothetical protein
VDVRSRCHSRSRGGDDRPCIVVGFSFLFILSYKSADNEFWVRSGDCLRTLSLWPGDKVRGPETIAAPVFKSTKPLGLLMTSKARHGLFPGPPFSSFLSSTVLSFLSLALLCVACLLCPSLLPSCPSC